MNHLANARHARLTRVGDLDVLEISHPRFHACLALQGAHLYRFAPAGDQNWLWLSPSARFEQGRSIRGGIPICWPWFGDPARNPAPVRSQLRGSDLPAHGFARTAPWSLAGYQESAEDLTLALVLEPSVDHREHWAATARAQITFRFSSAALTLELTTENNGSGALAITQALHTYLPASGIEQTTISGLEGVTYLDTLNRWQPRNQDGPGWFRGETDRIYQAAPDMTINTGERIYRLTARGSASTVVWNPGPDKARRLSDFPDNAWTSMLCVETANAADDYRELSAGQKHTLAMTLSRERRAS